MTAYYAPTRDMKFVIEQLARMDEIAALPGCEDATPDLVEAVLEEAGKLASEVLAPLNGPGDQQGARWSKDGVIPADGFADAYGKYVEGGWGGLAFSPELGGQGLPELLATATQEIWNSANMSFALCPLLTQGAVEAINAHASDELKAIYLEKMVSGEWTGTMNLTEPQAGSDLAAVRSRATPDGDLYRIKGQKIFITWGDHNMTENTVHLVLARTPDAPEGVKGISLFIVPKYLINADGSNGERNDAHCVSIEHKLGIHASPTCVMAFGDGEGAIGYLVGQENKGLMYMFTMMNEARLKVGLQGLAISERAYQQARDFAKTRVQGTEIGVKHGERVSIIHHPDVRRMLLTMKASNEAMRAFAYTVARTMDVARKHPDEAVRRTNQARVDLLIPVVKGWCTEMGVEMASLGVQVHGGMGFVEETGAAQHLRDSRIAPIYEGTTGIQAADLVGRKLAMDTGHAMGELIDDMKQTLADLAKQPGDDMAVIAKSLEAGVDGLEQATQSVLQNLGQDPNAAMAASTNYMMLAGYVCGGWQMARSAIIAVEKLATGEDADFHEAKLITARFYAEQLLPRANGLAVAAMSGGHSTMALAENQF